MTYDRNIVTHYGADYTGSTNVTTAFDNWKTDAGAQGLDCVLTIPSGTYKFADGYFPFDIANNVVVDGYGATFIDQGAGGIGWGAAGGTPGVAEDNTPSHNRVGSALIATAYAGQTSITLVTSSEASLFAVDRWIAIDALDLAGFGDPATPFYLEFRKITSIVGAVIHFAEPLLQTYLDTFPRYSAGDFLSVDQGGPATIHLMHARWGGSTHIKGITRVYGSTNDIKEYCKRQIATFTDVICTGAGQIAPTQSQTFTITGSATNWPRQLEVDKFLDHLIVSDGATVGSMEHQTSCPNLLTITDATVGTLAGTPRSVVASNSDFTTEVRFSPIQAYGRTDSFEADNCSFGTFSTAAPDINVSEVVRTGNIIQGSGLPEPWAIPGARIIMVGTYSNHGVFDVTAINSSAAITTTLPSSTSSWPTGVTDIYTHPCPRLRLTNCTGHEKAVDWSQAGAYDKPYASYSKRTYTQANSSGDQTNYPLWGNLLTCTITVTDAYAGAAGTALLKLPAFLNYKTIKSDGSTYDFGVTINLRAAGARIIYGDGTAPDGGIAGDTVPTLPEQVWFTGSMTPNIGTSLTDNSWSVTVEFIMDQGEAAGGRARRSIEIHGSTYRNA